MRHRICTRSGISPWSLLRRATWALCQVLCYLNAAGSLCTQIHFCFWSCKPSLPSVFSVVMCCITSQRTLLLKQLPCESKHSLGFVSHSTAIGYAAQNPPSLRGNTAPLTYIWSFSSCKYELLLFWSHCCHRSDDTTTLHCRVLPLLPPYCEGRMPFLWLPFPFHDPDPSLGWVAAISIWENLSRLTCFESRTLLITFLTG